METIDKIAGADVSAGVEASAPRRPGFVRRLLARASGALVVAGFSLAAMAGAASAAPLPTPSDLPDATEAITQAASTTASTLTSQFTAILPYVIAVAVLFTLFGIVKRLFGLKKSPH